MHLKPTAGSQISSLIFEKILCRIGPLEISHEKYIKDGKILADLVFELKVLPGSLADLSA